MKTRPWVWHNMKRQNNEFEQKTKEQIVQVIDASGIKMPRQIKNQIITRVLKIYLDNSNKPTSNRYAMKTIVAGVVYMNRYNLRIDDLMYLGFCARVFGVDHAGLSRFINSSIYMMEERT